MFWAKNFKGTQLHLFWLCAIAFVLSVCDCICCLREREKGEVEFRVGADFFLKEVCTPRRCYGRQESRQGVYILYCNMHNLQICFDLFLVCDKINIFVYSFGAFCVSHSFFLLGFPTVKEATNMHTRTLGA